MAKKTKERVDGLGPDDAEDSAVLLRRPIPAQGEVDLAEQAGQRGADLLRGVREAGT